MLGIAVEFRSLSQINDFLEKGSIGFTKKELKLSKKSKNIHLFRARTYIAKEVILKCLRKYLEDNIQKTDIELQDVESESPSVFIKGDTLRVLKLSSIAEILVSISINDEYVIAIAALRRG